MTMRTNTARWTGTRWRIDVQKDGTRKSFYSSKPGRTGQREANAKADKWLTTGVSDTALRVSQAYDMWYETQQETTSEGNCRNIATRWRHWIFFKWVFKTFVAVTLITNTFNIVMAVFDVTQHVINNAGGLIAGNTAVDAAALETMQDTLEAMEIGPLFALFLQCMVVQFTIKALSVVIFVIVYGRMIEIYLMTSMAPIPFSTFGNREQSMVGQNYLRSLFALGFQGFLIMICVGIYAVLIQSVSVSDDIIGSIWGILGYTVLLCFTLFKTGALAKSVFSAH